MYPEFTYYWTYLKTRWNHLRVLHANDRGAVSLEMILVVIGLVALTVIIIGALTARVQRESDTIRNG